MKFALKFDRFARVTALSTIAFLATTVFSGPAHAQDGLYSVQINKTEVLRLPAPASAVIVGNPDIADVSVHSADTLFIVGKGYGETNLVILDKNGTTMMSSDIQVITPQSRNQVRIFNANSRETYNCGPSCNPSPTLGDNGDFVEGNTASNSGNPLTNLFAAAANSVQNRTAGAGSSSAPANTPN